MWSEYEDMHKLDMTVMCGKILEQFLLTHSGIVQAFCYLFPFKALLKCLLSFDP